MLNVDIDKMLKEGMTTDEIMKVMRKAVDNEVARTKSLKQKKEQNDKLDAARRAYAEAQYNYSKALGLTHESENKEEVINGYMDIIKDTEKRLAKVSSLINSVFDREKEKAESKDPLDKIIDDFLSRL